MTSRLTDAVRISSTASSIYFDASQAPAARVNLGEQVTFETLDARSGALFDRTPGSLFELPRPSGRGNPVTGPLYISDVQPGDVIAVAIHDITPVSPAWVGAHSHVNPASPGRIPTSLGRICSIDLDQIVFNTDVRLPLTPMVGTIGTTPSGAPTACGGVGRHGGNLDHPILKQGTRVLLPVCVEGAYLYIGDVHAAQGDGELSGVGVEVAATVTVSIEKQQVSTLGWPWAETPENVAVLTCGASFEEAQRAAVDEALNFLESSLNLQPAEALALLSAAGNLRLGHAYGGGEITLRLELPKTLGVRL